MSAMLSSHMISRADGQSTTSNECPTTTPISISSTFDSLTSFLNSISLVTVHRAKQIIHSIMRRVSVGPTVRLSSRVGRTLTLSLCLLGRWVQVLVIWPWTIVGAGGIGRRSWEWVMNLFLAPSTSIANASLRRIAPSVLVEGAPHERETHVRKQEV